MLTNIGYIAESLAFISVLFLLSRKRENKYFALLFMLFIILLNEGNVIFKYYYETAFVTNVTFLVELGTYYYIYIKIVHDRNRRKTILFFLIATLIVWLINCIFWQDIWMSYQTYSYLFGVIGVVLGSFFYLFEQVFKQSMISNLLKDFWVWLSAGLLVAIFSEIPLMTILSFEKLFENDLDYSELMHVKLVTMTLYYLTISFAALWTMKK